MGTRRAARPASARAEVIDAWVALPGCQLVVKVDLENLDKTPAGAPANTKGPTIVQALRVDDKGVTEITDLSTIECPVECAGGNGNVASNDAGAPPPPSDMGANNLPTPPAWPATLAVDTETDVKGVARAGRLVIGDGYGDRVDIVPFDVVSTAIGAPVSVTLEPDDNNLLQRGVRTVRVGPRSPAGKFLYAVARDGSVRVIDLDRNVECETNPDPRWKTPTINLQQAPTRPSASADWTFMPPLPPPRSLGCFPLGDPSTPPRSVFASSPGIALPPGEVPSDVAFVHVDAPPGDINKTVAPVQASPGVLVGDFAWIITSDGKGTVVNIYDACPQPNQQDPNTQPGNYTPVCDPKNVQISLTTTVAQFGHPQPRLLDLVSHQIRNGHPRFFVPASESDSTGEARVPDNTNPCGVAVPPTSPGIPDGGVPDAGGCGIDDEQPAEPLCRAGAGDAPAGESVRDARRLLRRSDPRARRDVGAVVGGRARRQRPHRRGAVRRAGQSADDAGPRLPERQRRRLVRTRRARRRQGDLPRLHR